LYNKRGGNEKLHAYMGSHRKDKPGNNKIGYPKGRGNGARRMGMKLVYRFEWNDMSLRYPF
jgi:hypothetical protein